MKDEDYFPTESFLDEQSRKNVEEAIAAVRKMMEISGFERAGYFDRRNGYQHKKGNVKVGLSCCSNPNILLGIDELQPEKTYMALIKVSKGGAVDTVGVHSPSVRVLEKYIEGHAMPLFAKV